MVSFRHAKLSIKQTKDLYIRESADIFVNSAIELSMLAISGYDRKNNGNCLSEISIISKDKRFIADINITDYFLYDTNLSTDDYHICKNSANGYIVHNIKTEDSHGMVILEITVDANSTNPKNHGANIRLLRRTLQRP